MTIRKQLLLTVLLSALPLAASLANPPLDDIRMIDPEDRRIRRGYVDQPPPIDEIRPPKPEVIWVPGHWVRKRVEGNDPLVVYKGGREPKEISEPRGWRWVPGHWALGGTNEIP